jgi:hypothetical protein
VSLAVRRILAASLLLLGGLGLACGLLAGLLLPWLFDADLARVRRLEPLSYFAIEDGAPGREALIEGRLSERSSPGPEGFIVYRRYVATVEPDGDRAWQQVELVRPPLLIELPGGLVRVAGDYTLQGTLERYEQGPLRLEGLRAGAPVIAIGELVEGQEGIELRADTLAAGTRDDYLRSTGDASAFFSIFGWSFIICSAAMLAAGLALLLHLLRLRRANP